MGVGSLQSGPVFPREMSQKEKRKKEARSYVYLPKSAPVTRRINGD